MLQETVQITMKELKRYQERERKLSALENAGVDNWEWYGDAMAEFEDDETAEEIYGSE